MAAHFELLQGSAGKWRFNLHAVNGEIIATSDHYESKAAALNGIRSVKDNAAPAPIVDRTAVATVG